ncbi:MAG TPA: hypothetical protein VNS58_09850 [Puia sp.]|nr:hypothetical protein [Puia sp.]
MKRNQASFRSAEVLLCLVTAILVLAPFLAVSVYNHPIGDDFWCTSLVRKYGYWNAQRRLYDIVPPRYLELAISCLTPLAFGNFSGYKVIPILFILLFSYCIYRLFRGLAGPENRFQGNVGLLAFLFVSLYLSVLPGIAEGIYWTSALSVYHTGILLFVVWCNYMLKWYYQKRNPWYFVIICLCLAGMVGCNEIISFITLSILGVVLCHRVSGRAGRWDPLLLAQLLLSVACLLFVLRYKGTGNRYSLIQSKNSGRFFYSIGNSLLVDGYYTGRCLINPFFWAIVFAGYRPFRRFSYFFYSSYRGLFDFPRSFLAVWLFTLFLIPFAMLFLTGDRPPLRISNMIVFFFLYGLIGIAVFAIHKGEERAVPGHFFSSLHKHTGMVVIFLLIVGFMTRNNVSLTVKDLYSGHASQYDKALNQRYALIRQCKGDTCSVPPLETIPFAFWFCPDYVDPHFSDYFNKQIIFQIKNQ